MDWNTLFAGLVKQHLFFSLYRAFVESLVSENKSRLLAMQAASRSIDQQLEQLNIRFHNERQSEITSQLLDIITGYEAITKQSGHHAV